MAEPTSEFMYELLKKMHERFDKVDFAPELKSEVNNMRGTMVAMQGDLHNIYGILGRHERLDRIEHRLELRELAEPQKPFDHTT
jgi:hypothetical protein